ncbi:MAG: AlpA family phage regulatory protein [Colwellia sp.]
MNSNEQIINDKIIRIKGLVEKTGLSSCTIWRLRKTNEFPKSIQLSERLIGWRESEINEWLANKNHKDLK